MRRDTRSKLMTGDGGTTRRVTAVTWRVRADSFILDPSRSTGDGLSTLRKSWGKIDVGVCG